MKGRAGKIAAFVGVLLVIAFAIVVFRRPISQRSAQYLVQTQGANTVTQLMVRKVNTSNLFAALANRALNWAAIESTNYLVYINNLRNIGCPEETIRDIIITDIAKLYAKKRAALRAQYPPPPYWQTGEAWSLGVDSNPELQAKLRELQNEQRALVKELLGVDFRAEWSKFFDDDDNAVRAYGFLPESKRGPLQEILSKYEELEEQIYDRARGLMLDEDQAQLNDLERMRDAEIAQLLTPEEYKEYELRNSPVAEALREQLSGFEPTEEEFRKVFDLQKTFETQLASTGNLPDDEVRAEATEQMREALEGEIKKVLGEQRFAEYQRAQDADYKTMVQFSERLQIPRESADRVYDIKTQAELQKERIEADPNMSDEQRQAALNGLAANAHQQVQGILGDNAGRYLPIGGHWIQDLSSGNYPIALDVVQPGQTAPNVPLTAPIPGVAPPLPGVAPFPPQFPLPPPGVQIRP